MTRSPSAYALLISPHRSIAPILASIMAFGCLVAVACVPDGGQVQNILAGDGCTLVPSGAATRPGMGNGSGTVSTGVPTGADFMALDAATAARRVKNILTGQVPTDAEYEAAIKGSGGLEALVDTWLNSAAYMNKMEVFWGDAFQQSQAMAEDFHLRLDDTWFTPTDALLLNFRQSFGKTVAALVRAKTPFNQVATTQTHMLTTGMMVYMAYADTQLTGDSPGPGQGGPTKNRFLMLNGNWNYWMQKKGGVIPIADSANPQSSNYLRFYIPTLGTDNWRVNIGGNEGIEYCRQQDPVHMYAASSFNYQDGLCRWLYAALKGDEYRFFNPDQNAGSAQKWCASSASPSLMTDADHADWRMVTITAPTSTTDPQAQSKFYDLAGLRAAKTLSIFAPRVGFFTTPSFFSQYHTNISNQARSIANQTLIVGLGHAFDGALSVKLTNPPGLNGQHASDPACLACHLNLDPMRQFFRQNYSLTFSAQLDDTQLRMPGTFAFDGVTGSSSSMADLGKMIANHPRFKMAWTQKLCNWANSTVCDPTDPELIRISEVFAASNYDWQALAKAMFTSPLVTYLAPTQTTQNFGVTAPILRRANLCAALDARLGLTDSCGLQELQDGLRGSDLANLAYSLPKDAYSRGAVDSIYVTQPDLFYRNVVENICSILADKVVDTQGTVTFSSSAPKTATDKLSTTLLGLEASSAQAVSAVLLSHFTEAKNAGANDTTALKSTFVLACLSPQMVSVGQ